VIARAKHFLSLPVSEQRAYAMTTWWLIAIRMMFKLMTFEQIGKFISRRKVNRSSSQTPTLARLAEIIENAGRRIPSTCLSRSLAGALVLARFGHPSDVLIGVSTEKDFQAHAWLESHGTAITERDVAAVQWNQLTRVSLGS
jgi:hypothetical protein